MKKIDRIRKKIKERLTNLNDNDIEYLIESGMRWVKAIKEERVICSIVSVSKSGMSRQMKFFECKKGKGTNRHHYLNFYSMFKSLGESMNRDNGCIRVHGCGMDMVFHTNYTTIHELHRLGFINKKECHLLQDKTPTCI